MFYVVLESLVNTLGALLVTFGKNYMAERADIYMRLRYIRKMRLSVTARASSTAPELQCQDVGVLQCYNEARTPGISVSNV